MDDDGWTGELLNRAVELSAIAESGLAYSTDPFDIERFHRVGEIARDMLQAVSTTPLPEYRVEVASVAGYTTPKLDVRAGVFDERGRVLLAREVADEGRWTLPGGWCDVLETPTEAVEREFYEEAGARVRARHLAGVIDRSAWPYRPHYDRHVYKLYFVCDLVGTIDLTYTSAETSELAWFPVDDLPVLSTSRVLPEQIRMLEHHWRTPGPAHVD